MKKYETETQPLHLIKFMVKTRLSMIRPDKNSIFNLTSRVTNSIISDGKMNIPR